VAPTSASSGTAACRRCSTCSPAPAGPSRPGPARARARAARRPASTSATPTTISWSSRSIRTEIAEHARLHGEAASPWRPSRSASARAGPPRAGRGDPGGAAPLRQADLVPRGQRNEVARADERLWQPRAAGGDPRYRARRLLSPLERAGQRRRAGGGPAEARGADAAGPGGRAAERPAAPDLRRARRGAVLHLGHLPGPRAGDGRAEPVVSSLHVRERQRAARAPGAAPPPHALPREGGSEGPPPGSRDAPRAAAAGVPGGSGAG